MSVVSQILAIYQLSVNPIQTSVNRLLLVGLISTVCFLCGHNQCSKYIKDSYFPTTNYNFHQKKANLFVFICALYPLAEAMCLSIIFETNQGGSTGFFQGDFFRMLTCKQKIWGGNWLCLRPYLIAFSMLLKLAGNSYFLTIDLARFIKNI